MNIHANFSIHLSENMKNAKKSAIRMASKFRKEI